MSRCSRQIKEHAYVCLVIPQLEYSTSTSFPYTQKDIKIIESVQHRAARFTLNNYEGASSVKEMIADLNLDSLENRRKWNDLIFFFKIQNNLMDIPFPNNIVEYHRSQRLHHIHNYRQLPSSVNAYNYSFFVRTIPVWSALPSTVVQSKCADRFRSLIVK